MSSFSQSLVTSTPTRELVACAPPTLPPLPKPAWVQIADRQKALRHIVQRAAGRFELCPERVENIRQVIPLRQPMIARHPEIAAAKFLVILQVPPATNFG